MTPGSLPVKLVYLGITVKLQFGTNYGKAQASLNNRGQGLAFIGEKEQLGREMFRVVMASHWLSVAVYQWLGCNQVPKPVDKQPKRRR